MITIQLNVIYREKKYHEKQYNCSVILTEHQIQHSKIDWIYFWINKIEDEIQSKLKIDLSSCHAFSFTQNDEPGIWYWYRIFKN